MFEGGRVYKLLKFNFLSLLYCFIRVCIHCSIYAQPADNFLTIAIVILYLKCTYFSGQTICGNTLNLPVVLVVFWDKYINCLSITVLISIQCFKSKLRHWICIIKFHNMAPRSRLNFNAVDWRLRRE